MMWTWMIALAVFAGILGAELLLIRALSPASATGGTASVFTTQVAPSPVVRALGTLSKPGPEAVRGLERELIQAGFRSPQAVPLYLAVRTLLALTLPAAGYPFLHARPLALAVAVELLLAGTGYLFPVFVLRGLAEARRRRIRSVFPNALDMLVNCLESGLGLDAALRYVARELSGIAPELAGEFDLLNAELQAGLPRAEALGRMRERNGVDAVDGLVSVVAQAERYGVGIASAMRSHAQMARKRRILDAERRAAEAAPKLTVTMVLFILPPLFIVLLGPTVIRLVTTVLPTLGAR